MSRPTELRALTGVRGIAAWWVVLYHIRVAIPQLPAGWRALFGRGYLAVDFFFLLSGFVIWLAWHQRLPGGGWTGVALFWRKRVARIWPLHLLMLAVAVAMAVLLVATGHAERAAFPLAELPLHLLLLQNWGFTHALAWNDPAWSISAEFAAYLLFPLLVFAIDWRRVPSLPLIAIALAILGGLHLAMAGAPELGIDIPRLGLRRCLAEFATGTIVAALWLRWRERRWIAWPATVVGAAALGGWGVGLAETLAVPIAFAALLLALALSAGMRGNPLESRPVHYLGLISYATYLAHVLLWRAFKLAFVRHANAVPPGAILAFLLLVLAVSVALYHLVERPAQRWLDSGRLPFQRRARKGSAAPQAGSSASSSSSASMIA